MGWVFLPRSSSATCALMSDPAQGERDLDSVVLGLLLDTREHWSVDEIVRELEDPAARDALSRLAAVGLIHRHDEFAFPTRAARRAAELEITN
jgi:predicted transcriptional regulator